MEKLIIKKIINAMIVISMLFSCITHPLIIEAKAYDASEHSYVRFSGKVRKIKYTMYGTQEKTGYVLQINKKITMKSVEYGTTREDCFMVWFDSEDEENEFKEKVGKKITVIGRLESGSPMAVGRYEKYALESAHIIGKDIQKIVKSKIHKDSDRFYFGNSSGLEIKRKGKRLILRGEINVDTGFGSGYQIPAKYKKNIFILSSKTRYYLHPNESIDGVEVSESEFLKNYNSNDNIVYLQINDGKVTYIGAKDVIQL